MDIQAEKLKLIEWLLSLNDEAAIEKLNFLRESFNDATDWWDTISEGEKQSIERGLKDLESDNVVPHSQVREKYGKYL